MAQKLPSAEEGWHKIYVQRADLTLRYGMWVFAGLALLWFSLGFPQRASNHVVATFGSSLAWYLNKKHPESMSGSILYLLFMLWAIMGDIVCAGMTASPSIWVLPIFPMLAGHLLGSRFVLPTAGLTCALIVGVHWFEDIKALEPKFMPLYGENELILLSITVGYCRVAYFSRKTLEESSKTLKVQAIDLIQSKFKADRASIAKSTFLANMSQQVKIPLQGASRDARDLVESVGRQDRDHALALRECTDRIEWIVSDIVDISRVESGSLTAQFVALDFDMLRDSITLECADVAAQAKIRIDFQQEGQAPEVLGDPRLISRLVTILVLDAICRAQSSVSIDFLFEASALDSVVLQLNIRHDGLLEDVEGSEVVFGMRVQDDERGVPARIGLGLSMAESLASYMGGGVDVAHDSSAHEYQRVARICLPRVNHGARAA